MLLRLVVPHPNGVVQAVDRVLVVASFVLLPFVTAIVVRLLAPRYFTLPGLRLKLTLVAIVATVAVVGFLVGHFNDRFLTCEDFIVAGDDPAPNCAHGTTR